MRSIAALLLLAALTFAQGVVLTHLWTSPPRTAVPMGLAVSEDGHVLLTDTPLSGGGYAIMLSPTGAILSGLYYAQGVGSATYAHGLFTFATLAGNVMLESPNGTIIKAIPVSPEAAFMVSLSPDGKEFVTCHAVCEAYKGSKRIWVFKDVKEVTSPPAWVGDTIYVPDAGAKKVYALNAANGKVLYSISYKEPVYAVAACRDVLAVGAGNELYLYSVAKGFPQLQAKTELPGPVNDVVFSPDCNFMLVAVGKGIAVVDRNGKVVNQVTLNADVMLLDWKGKYVAAATVDSAGVERVSLFQATVLQGTPKARYKLTFKQVNALSVVPLTYPSPKGTVFVLARTMNGYEIWTLSHGKLVGKVKVPKDVRFVQDVRMGEVATLDDKLLVVINQTLYEVYGDSMKPLTEFHGVKGLSTFVKIGNDIYAFEVSLERGNNTSTVICSYRELGKGVVKSFKFVVPTKGPIGVVADAIDAEGCTVVWTNGTSVNYYYKGSNGEGKGSVSLINALGFGVVYMEVKKGETHPFVAVTLPTNEPNVVEMDFHDVLNGKVLKVKVPALYAPLGVGDYLGEGYYGDFALVALNRKNFTYELIVINTHNITRTYELVKMSRTMASVSGLALHEGYVKNVFGLGVLNGPTVDIKTNIGTLKFALEGVAIVPSRLSILLTLTKTQMCYTAAINPVALGGNVYLATGCVPR